jgi:hypothetical protein
MSKRGSKKPSKRPLTKEEVKGIREWMDKAAKGQKPSIRQIAKALNRTRPTIIKSLKGWKGIQRNRPQPKPKPLIPKPKLDLNPQPVKLEPFTVASDEKTI